jgi:transcriptional regulator with XRE-family HTH domain
MPEGATPADLAALGRAVRELRVAAALSQEDLGDASGLHRNYVGGIERGERNPSYASLMTLARALRVPLSRLIALAEGSNSRRSR